MAKQELNSRSISCTTVQDLKIKTLDSFIRPSCFFFNELQLDNLFFMEDVKNWSEVLSYQGAEKTVRALKVVNDYAEQAVPLATTFNSALTKHNKQKQRLFQTVKSNHKRFSNRKKHIILNKHTDY